MADKPNLTPVANQSPRDRYRSLANNVTLHRNMVDSAAFERGVEVALLQYQHDLAAQTKDAVSASAAGFKMQGALEFLGSLRNLVEPTPILQRMADRNLNHNV